MEMGGCTGLVVMGSNLQSKGCRFESQHCVLDGHFYIIFVKIVMFVLKRPKINEKEARDGPFQKTLMPINLFSLHLTNS